MSDTDLGWDWESFSECDLRSAGAHAYAMHPSTDILCAAYAFGDEPAALWLPGEPCPPRVVEHVRAGGRIVAWNAPFEAALWEHVAAPKYGFPPAKPEQFWCTAAQAANMGLPRDLDGAGGAFDATVRKDPTGRRVMLKLSQPRRPTKGDARTRWTPEMAPADFDHLYRYCVQDVGSERAVKRVMRPLAAREREIFLLDGRINRRGVKIDRALIDAALRVVEDEQARLNAELANATDHALTACTQATRLVAWLTEQGVDADSVASHEVAALLARDDLPDAARTALALRKEAAKSSTAKLHAMLKAACPDDRIRGSLLYYGAARTGRWSGRLHQPQNFPRKAPEPGAVEALLSGDAGLVRLLYGSPLDVVSTCLRPCMIAEDGHDLMAPDFSNVEGRGLAWLAGEEWKLAAFAAFDAGTGPDLYKVTYGRSVGVPVEEVDGAGRQIGKVIELACGYQGWTGAFQTFARLYGLKVSDDEAARLAGAWRDAHPATVDFWWSLENAALRAVANPNTTFDVGPVAYRRQDGFLWCRLPSGRVLAYANPSIEKNDRGKDAVHFWGVPNPAKPILAGTRRWAKIGTYGGMLAENITQAMCRDLLAEAMLRLDARGYPICLTVHDEIVIEAPHDFGSPAEVKQIVSEVPAWAKGMPIAVGKVSRERRYGK